MTLSPRPGSGPSSELAPQQVAPGPPLRASDTDRESVVQTLRDATAQGMLDLDEFEERMSAAYGARFRHELQPLTTDLRPGPGPIPPGWQAVTMLAVLQARTSWARVPWSALLRSRPGLAVLPILLVVLAVLGVLAADDLSGIELLGDD